uniref:(northern house mosquito) hypothetical protein n=1 Tax=Culex pipiens TaxID=7175 RepID=A0A8D8MDC7_CULPI
MRSGAYVRSEGNSWCNGAGGNDRGFASVGIPGGYAGSKEGDHPDPVDDQRRIVRFQHDDQLLDDHDLSVFDGVLYLWSFSINLRVPRRVPQPTRSIASHHGGLLRTLDRLSTASRTGVHHHQPELGLHHPHSRHCVPSVAVVPGNLRTSGFHQRSRTAQVPRKPKIRP